MIARVFGYYANTTLGMMPVREALALNLVPTVRGIWYTKDELKGYEPEFVVPLETELLRYEKELKGHDEFRALIDEPIDWSQPIQPLRK